MPNAHSINRGGNAMTTLLNKIERRLGLAVLPLPEAICKKTWHHVIEEDTIPTFSIYFPHKITVVVDNKCRKDGWFFIDSQQVDGAKILGVGDLDWDAYKSFTGGTERFGLRMTDYNYYDNDYLAESIALRQVGADLTSFLNLGIYLEFEPPNKVKLVTATNAIVSENRPYPITLFVEHPSNLMTISPTMMETFEKLAICDVANMLFQQLKYYDGMETVFTNIDLKIEDLRGWAEKREEIVRELEEAHVSTANENQPCIMSV